MMGIVVVTVVSRTLLSGSEFRAFLACVLMVTYFGVATWALMRSRRPPPGSDDNLR